MGGPFECSKRRLKVYKSETQQNKTSVRSCNTKNSTKKLENIDEDSPTSWLPVSSSSCAAPETPTESMEFLARSWSLSAMELSKALFNTHITSSNTEKRPPPCSAEVEAQDSSLTAPQESLPSGGSGNPPVSPRDSQEMKELFLIHQALNPEFPSNQQLLKNGLYKSMLKGRTMGRWLKEQKERKKQEIRAQNAQLHAAVSVAGVGAAVAALAASNAMSAEMEASRNKTPSKIPAAMASAAALVASHCIEIAEDMGASHDQISAVVNSAISARTIGDILTLTAGAATALRGSATLTARLQKGYGTTASTLVEEKVEGKESNILEALNFVTTGGELLKRTRKGDLHWKQVSFNINSNWQVVAKMKNKCIAGTFIKKKCVVSGVYSDIPKWSGRDSGDSDEQRAYFGIKTADRVIEFECASKSNKQMWTEGVQHLLSSVAT